MKKKLIALLLSGILGIIPVGSAFAEELSSGEEETVIMDESAYSEFKVLTEEVSSPQEETPSVNEILKPEDPAPDIILSAGEAEDDLPESGIEIPAVGATYSGTWGTCKWDINSDGVLTIHAGTGTDNEELKSPWNEYKDSIYSIVAEKGVVLPWTSSHLFFKLENCKSIDLSLADSSNVAEMFFMFASCISLANLNLSSFDTSNVYTMSNMFNNCRSLERLDLSNFDTSNVKYMSAMFRNCRSLISLNLSSFNTSNVKDLRFMFADCYKLTSLDLSSFDTSNADKLQDMFLYNYNLSKIIVGSNFSFKGNNSSQSYAYLPDKAWYSVSTDKAYTAEEITETRNNIADTYSTSKTPILQQPTLIAAYNGAKGIGLKFYKADNATEYVLFRKFDGIWSSVCTFSAADPSLQIDGNKIMYTDTSVAQNYGKGYIYSVAAKNGDQETTYDTKGAAIYRLTPPTLTGAVNSSAGTATVSWKGVFGRTETNGTYDLQYAEYKDGKAGTFKSVTTLPGYNNLTLKTTVSGLTKDCRYVFRIRCAKTNKDRGTYYSEYSKWLSVTITK